MGRVNNKAVSLVGKVEGKSGTGRKAKAAGKPKVVAKAKGSGKARTTGKSEVKGRSNRCPCCGEPVGSKATFVPGHDGRIKGWFLKKEKGKLPSDVRFNKELERMYEVWRKNRGLSIKEVVARVRG